jgi:hypothetical protein
MHWTGAWILGLLVVAGSVMGLALLHFTPLGALIHKHVPDRPQRRMFLAAISFTLTFAAARGLAYSNAHHIGPFHDVYMSGRHIHHMVWGILLLLLVGYGWLAEVGTGQGHGSIVMSRLMSLLYGAGAALTLDEFALWLNLRDVYWAREGRASLDAVVLFAGLLLIGIVGRGFWAGVLKEFRRR